MGVLAIKNLKLNNIFILLCKGKMYKILLNVIIYQFVQHMP